jgi:flavoprotein
MKTSFILTVSLLTVLFVPMSVKAAKDKNVEIITLDPNCDTCILQCVLASVKAKTNMDIRDCADTSTCRSACKTHAE